MKLFISSGYERHPLSEAWGDMPEDALLELAEDIKANGQKDAVTVLNGAVLDGWHRHQACQIAGIETRAIEYGGDDPAGFVISKNRHRRHCDESQVAIAVVRCNEWYSRGENSKSVCRPITTAKPATTAEMAEQAGVSEATITRAKTAERGGLGDEVASGKKTVSQAAKEVRESKKPPEKNQPKKLTELEKAKVKINDLKNQISQSEEAIRDLTDELEHLQDAGLPESELITKNEQLRHQLRAVESQRDEQMQIANSFKRECAALRKRLGE